MNPDELLKELIRLLREKKTHPRLLTTIDIRDGINCDIIELREPMMHLIKNGSVKVHKSAKFNLIEVCNFTEK